MLRWYPVSPAATRARADRSAGHACSGSTSHRSLSLPVPDVARPVVHHSRMLTPMVARAAHPRPHVGPTYLTGLTQSALGGTRVERPVAAGAGPGRRAAPRPASAL